MNRSDKYGMLGLGLSESVTRFDSIRGDSINKGLIIKIQIQHSSCDDICGENWNPDGE